MGRDQHPAIGQGQQAVWVGQGGVCGSANIKGTAGALVQNVALQDVALAVASPLPMFRKDGKPWLISCSGGADNETVSFSGLAVSYASAADQAQWRGIQPTPGCVKLEQLDSSEENGFTGQRA